MPASHKAFIHELAQVEQDVVIGAGSKVWSGAHVRAGARIGADCTIGANVTVDIGVIVGDRCKIQNAALLYHGVRVGNGVFVGPGAIITNDRQPRAVTPEGLLRSDADWTVSEVIVEDGASIGANATVVAGTRIGAWAMVGAGAVVTRDVPAHAVVVGVPAEKVGWACYCGTRTTGEGELTCAACGRRFEVGSGYQ